jgi:indole-3-glycerol phosphate synthase
MNILEAIVRHKRVEVDHARSKQPLEELRKRIVDLPPTRQFRPALRKGALSIIAEVKKASPSRGLLTNQFDPVALAKDYVEGGASAISVVTDERFFQGHPSYVQAIKAAVPLPLLRKDFIIDEYQVYESRAIGADAILLIVVALSDAQLSSLYECARSVGLDVVVETHDEQDIERANRVGADIIGINNRDLSTFDVSLQHSVQLRKLIHAGAVAISESGIQTREDVVTLRAAGFDALLIGEGVVSAQDPVGFLQKLLQA